MELFEREKVTALLTRQTQLASIVMLGSGKRRKRLLAEKCAKLNEEPGPHAVTSETRLKYLHNFHGTLFSEEHVHYPIFNLDGTKAIQRSVP
jgi:hypothetical protein